MPVTEGDVRRFLDRVDLSVDCCWEWTGPYRKLMYGGARWAGRDVLAHRLAYEMFVGPIPDGLVLDHLCRNASCVRPDHLEPVTQRENVLRGTAPAAINATKTHCDNGHEFTEENTYLSPRARGGRECRICRRDASRVNSRLYRARSQVLGACLPRVHDVEIVHRGRAATGLCACECHRKEAVA